MLCDHGVSGSLFPSYDLLKIKENLRRVHLEFPCRHCRKQTSETLLSSIASNHVFLPNFLPELLQTGICLWFMPDGTPTYFLLAVWGTFKQRVSGKIGRMRWINSTACSFCFKGQGGHFEHFFQSSRGCNSKTTFQSAYVETFCVCVCVCVCVLWGGLNFRRFGREVLFTLRNYCNLQRH
jgi:hypothetical protein